MEFPENNWREKLHRVIYESDTAAGKLFDIILLFLIFSSITVVMIDSMESVHAEYGDLLTAIEWGFTILFTIEYILRLICIRKPLRYVFSFLGIVDLLAIIPSYLSIFFARSQYLVVFRALRLLRLFRIFKLTHFLSELHFLRVAVQGSLRKIGIFMFIVMSTVTILGSLMYLIEHRQNGFTSIPDSIYWAIVTITTVGYGDIAPVTPLGKFVASIIMLLGYGIIAVPTGIVTTEMAIAARNKRQQNQACPNCGKEGHDDDARFCKFCGSKL
jgi:voltage-gated potassium channel